MNDFSEYILYADESGSAYLDGVIDPDFPVFVLAMVLVRKADYANRLVPRMELLKFNAVGHDQLILHERDIRRQQKQFAFLQGDVKRRQIFLSEIDKLVTAAPIEIFAAVINKRKLREKYADPWSPYGLSLSFMMERILPILCGRGQRGKTVHVVFECRGKREDRELELDFRRIANNENQWGYSKPDFRQLNWEPMFVDKKSNSTGLQIADLVARPIGLRWLRPNQQNHAYRVLEPKIKGLKVFP